MRATQTAQKGGSPGGVRCGPCVSSFHACASRARTVRGAHSGPPPAGWFNIFTVASITEGPRMSEDRQQERKDLERPGMPGGAGRRGHFLEFRAELEKMGNGREERLECRLGAWPLPSRKGSGERRQWRNGQGSGTRKQPTSPVRAVSRELD